MRPDICINLLDCYNYETAKNLLCFEVVGTEQNADMLANIPHTDMDPCYNPPELSELPVWLDNIQ